MKIKRFFLILSAFCSFQLMHARISENVADHRSLFSEQLTEAWENPALIQYRFKTSLTEVKTGGGFADDRKEGYLKAYTYMKFLNRNVTGFAEYINTHRISGQFSEVSDEEIVGPYLTYASGDGTMKSEQYSFGGSYTALFGSWNIGISGRYIAGLHYRTEDPRPRNITGNLYLCGGTSVNLSEKYTVSASVIFRKYKQNSKLMFVSELGKNNVYHLTGLGTTYGRFTDQGESVYYKGYCAGGSVGLFPQTYGVYAFAGYKYFGITQIITDLNKLPLTRTSTPEWEGTIGWRSTDWMAGLNGSWERRRGTENLFGDANSGQYPQIGSQTLYSRTHRRLGISAAMKKGKLSGIIRSSCEAMKEKHLFPDRELRWRRIISELDVYRWFQLGSQGFAGIRLGGSLSSPLSDKISGIILGSDCLEAVTEKIIRSVSQISKWRFGGEAAIEILFPIKGKYLLGGQLSYSHSVEGHDSGIFAAEFMF